jgi:hypothetical protein
LRKLEEKNRLIFGLFAFALLSYSGLASVQGQVPRNGDRSAENTAPVIHFQRVKYPLYAQVRGIKGVVVLTVHLNASGYALRVEPLSGPPALLQEAVASAKAWRFDASKSRMSILVYWFRIQGLCEPPCESGFEFYPPNLAVITTGSQIAVQ